MNYQKRLKRKSSLTRKTLETEVSISLVLDGKGESGIGSPIGFLNHVLQGFCKHGKFDLALKASGDLEVDQHHTVEDIGIALGKAVSDALGDRRGINRAGYFIFPMDDALALAAVDLSGRPFLQYACTFSRRYCGGLDTDALEDFFYGFSVSCKANVVVKVLAGRSDHHKAEALFKAFGKALAMACSRDRKAMESIPSTKGVL